MRAGSKIHVEYEVLKHLMDKIDLSELEEKMVHKYKSDDKYDRLVKRWEDGSGEIARQMQKLITSRLHRLPKKHPAYKEKEE